MNSFVESQILPALIPVIEQHVSALVNFIAEKHDLDREELETLLEEYNGTGSLPAVKKNKVAATPKPAAPRSSKKGKSVLEDVRERIDKLPEGKYLNAGSNRAVSFSEKTPNKSLIFHHEYRIAGPVDSSHKDYKKYQEVLKAFEDEDNEDEKPAPKPAKKESASKAPKKESASKPAAKKPTSSKKEEEKSVSADITDILKKKARASSNNTTAAKKNPFEKVEQNELGLYVDGDGFIWNPETQKVVAGLDNDAEEIDDMITALEKDDIAELKEKKLPFSILSDDELDAFRDKYVQNDEQDMVEETRSRLKSKLVDEEEDDGEDADEEEFDDDEE